VPVATNEVIFTQDSLLEACRTQWQYGEWDALLQLGEADIIRDRERGKLAALMASVHGHAGDAATAKAFAARAISWGCDRSTLIRLMISAAQNTLGRAAAAIGEDDVARARFREAITTVEPRANAKLLGRTRQVRETARMGLLPDAQKLLEADLEVVKADPDEHRGRMKILNTEFNLLKHELSLSLRRGQVYQSGGNAEAEGPEMSRVALEARSVSQLGQDLWVLERSGLKRGGFFVEFGATDGVVLSNTFLLEKEFGWTGLCAEPNPAFYEELRKNRTCTVSDTCIGPTTGETVEFIMADVYGGMEKYGFDDNHADKRAAYRDEGYSMTLPTQSLDDFLEEHNAPREIDFLSIDTEGSEFAILNALSFDRWRIRLITVEHNHTPMREQIHDLLTAKGYVRTEAEWDDWYELA
jgi:FkbM family methyltransferase